jgi:predicted ABC-type ATPase
VSEKPVLLIVAGPNGSGKTTLTRQLRASGVDLGFYINPDVIAETLAGSYEDRVAQAQRIADEQRQDCLARRVSFSFETVMSHPSKIDVLKQARAADYLVALYFVATESPELNIARVRQRVSLGGHDVPQDRIVARYQRTIALLPQAILQSDRALLFDNSFRYLPDQDVLLTPLCEIQIAQGTPGPLKGKLRVRAGGRMPVWLSGAVEHLQQIAVLRT